MWVPTTSLKVSTRALGRPSTTRSAPVRLAARRFESLLGVPLTTIRPSHDGPRFLNATMVRSQALKEFRTVQGRHYQFFYNPMWGHFGDRDREPPGTYYRDSNQQVNYYWNMFDQVLIRPSLLGMLPRDGVEIVTHAGRFPLLASNGLPNRAVASDHLPLLFRLAF